MLIYPKEWGLDVADGYPLEENFTVCRREDGKGNGVYTNKHFTRGEMVTRITGNIVPHQNQHTLQITPSTFLYDIYFTGYLLHSCAPNCFLDMGEFEIWALRDIEPGQPLTIDYAVSEDTLHVQFPCLCETPNCRYWITGRKEKVNAKGKAHIKEQQEIFGRGPTEIITAEG